MPTASASSKKTIRMTLTMAPKLPAEDPFVGGCGVTLIGVVGGVGVGPGVGVGVVTVSGCTCTVSAAVITTWPLVMSRTVSVTL